jgi:hypothetical protein
MKEMKVRWAAIAALLSACSGAMDQDENVATELAAFESVELEDYDFELELEGSAKPACSGTLGCKYASCLADCQTPDRLSTQYCDTLCHCIVYEDKSRMQCEFESPYVDIREDPPQPDKELVEEMPADDFSQSGALEPFAASCLAQDGTLTSKTDQAACCTLCDEKAGCTDLCVDVEALAKSEPPPDEVLKEWEALVAEVETSSGYTEQQSDDDGYEGCKLVCRRIFWPVCSIIISHRTCLEMAADCVLTCYPGAGELGP